MIGAANVTVTKVNFTASATADTMISNLTVKSYGTAALNNQDIALVKIFDSGTQVGLSQAMVQGTANFVFSPAISITKGTVKTLSIVVSMQVAGAVPAPTPSATVKLGIESAAKISGATFTGTFPVVGNAMAMVAGGALGTLNVAGGAVVPTNQTYVGAKDVVLGNFTVSAGTNEDVNVSSYSVSFDPALATVADTDITNVRVKVDGVLTGSSANFSSRRATVLFGTVIPIVKGTAKAFQVIADISAGAARNIALQAAIDAAAGVGVTSGAGVAGPFNAINLGAANVIAIGAGNLAVSVSPSSPQGSAANLVISTTPQVLGVYDVRAVGEDILISFVDLLLGGGAGAEAGTISNVGLYDENGALLSQQVNLLADAGNNRWGAAFTAFAMNWTVPANTTKKLYVKGSTNLVTGPAPAAVTATLVPANSIVATGMSSSGQAGPNNITSQSALALPPVSVNQAGTFATTGDTVTSPYNQNVLGPVSQVVIGTLKFTAQNEDQRLRDAVLTAVQTGAADNNDDLFLYVTGVALADGTVPISNFNAPQAVGGDNLNTVTFATADIFTPVTFVKGVPKTLNILANVISPLPLEGTTVRWTINAAGDLRTTGVTSGVVANSAGNPIDLRVNIAAAAGNEGGTYTLRSNVLEMKKSAGSPSGTISRGTFANVALFDLESKGGAL
jgi:hypothetical protein